MSRARQVRCPECDKEFMMGSAEYKLMVLDFGTVNWLSLKCPNSENHYKLKIRKKVDAVPQEAKQKFLDLMHQGMKLGDARGDLEVDVAAQILTDNIEPGCYILRKVAK